MLGQYSSTLHELEIGAMRETAEWGLPLNEGLELMLPRLGEFRDMARIVCFRARLEIAQGRFDQAVHTIQMGIVMGRHVGDGQPTLIQTLVGIAIESMMLDRVQELIGRGGPNMYWRWRVCRRRW